MRIGHFDFLNCTQVAKELKLSKPVILRFRSHPLFEEGVHRIKLNGIHYWNLRLVQNLILNQNNPSKHREAVEAYKEQVPIQMGFPSVQCDRPHISVGV